MPRFKQASMFCHCWSISTWVQGHPWLCLPLKMAKSVQRCKIHVSSGLMPREVFQRGSKLHSFVLFLLLEHCRVSSAAELKGSISPRCACLLNANYFVVCVLGNCNRLVGPPPWLSVLHSFFFFFTVLLLKSSKSSVYFAINWIVSWLVMLMGK